MRVSKSLDQNRQTLTEFSSIFNNIFPFETSMGKNTGITSINAR